MHVVALTESAAAHEGIIPFKTFKTLGNLPKIIDAIKNNNYEVFKNNPSVQRAIQDGVQFGAISDINIGEFNTFIDDVSNIVDKVTLGTSKIITKPMKAYINANNKFLWNYLHNTYKLHAYETLIKRVSRNEAVNNSVELCQQNLTDIESAGNSALNKIYNLSTKSLNDISASQEIALNSISDEKDKADNIIKTGIKNINQGISDINEGLDNISNAEIRALEDIDTVKKQAVEDLGNIANVDFSAYALNSDLSEVAKSGDYYDLKNLPTNLSDFQNDAGYLTEHQDISGKANISDLAAVATSGDYADLDNKPSIPEIPKNISSFTNDSGYQTATQVNSLISALNNIKSLSSSGTISLTDNTIHRITVTGTVTFSLPSSLSSSLFHQMLVQLYMASVYTINLGTSKYFSNESPDLKTAGYYNIIYEHNGSSWVVGAIYKGK